MIGVCPPDNREATLWNIAATGVMAGFRFAPGAGDKGSIAQNFFVALAENEEGTAGEPQDRSSAQLGRAFATGLTA